MIQAILIQTMQDTAAETANASKAAGQPTADFASLLKTAEQSAASAAPVELQTATKADLPAKQAPGSAVEPAPELDIELADELAGAVIAAEILKTEARAADSASKQAKSQSTASEAPQAMPDRGGETEPETPEAGPETRPEISLDTTAAAAWLPAALTVTASKPAPQLAAVEPATTAAPETAPVQGAVPQQAAAMKQGSALAEGTTAVPSKTALPDVSTPETVEQPHAAFAALKPQSTLTRVAAPVLQPAETIEVKIPASSTQPAAQQTPAATAQTEMEDNPSLKTAAVKAFVNSATAATATATAAAATAPVMKPEKPVSELPKASANPDPIQALRQPVTAQEDPSTDVVNAAAEKSAAKDTPLKTAVQHPVESSETKVAETTANRPSNRPTTVPQGTNEMMFDTLMRTDLAAGAASVRQSDTLANATNTVPFQSDPALVRQALLDQTRQGIESGLQNGKTSLRLHLKPEDLGGIDLRVTAGPQGASVLIRAENPATGRLLEQNLSDLRTALQDAGVQLSNLSVGQQNAQGGQFSGQHAPSQHGLPNAFQRHATVQTAANAEETDSAAVRRNGAASQVNYLV